MNISPGYSWNGALCPQAADVDGDGLPELLFAREDEHGMSALVCVGGQGKTQWTCSVGGCPWGGLQAGVDHWTFGRFTGRQQGLDVYVDLHRRSKGSGEGWVLRGDTGKVAWERRGLTATEAAMPFGGGIPAVADVNGDGIMELIFSGRDGLLRAVSGKDGCDIWEIAVPGQPIIADVDGDGFVEVLAVGGDGTLRVIGNHGG